MGFCSISRALVCLSLTFSLTAATSEELVERANAAVVASDYPQAISLFNQVLAEHPEWQAGWLNLGKCYYVTHQFALAQHALQQDVALAPNDADGRAFLALSEIQTGSFAPALADISTALADGAALPSQIADHLRTQRAFLYLKLGRFDEAIRSLSGFLGSGQTPDLLRSLGLAILRLAVFPTDIPTDEISVTEAAGRALYLQLTGSTSQSKDAFEALVKGFPDVENVHYAYG